MFDSGVLILTFSFGNVTQILHQADISIESGPQKIASDIFKLRL